jgi:hypothetical protein
LNIGDGNVSILNIGADNDSLSCIRWNDDGSNCAIDGVVMGKALPLMAA